MAGYEDICEDDMKKYICDAFDCEEEVPESRVLSIKIPHHLEGHIDLCEVHGTALSIFLDRMVSGS